MAKVINITDKFNDTNPIIMIGEKEYPINDSMETVLKFEELSSTKSQQGMIDAMEMALGKEASKELNIKKLSIAKFKVLLFAVTAAMQDMSYEDAEARFQKE